MTTSISARPLLLEVFAREQTLLRDFVWVSVGVLWVALLAQVSIPLPFTPVPITGQTLGVLMVGAGLGSRLGVMSMLAYLLVGMVGFPVFEGASSGVEKIYGATGGYLVGFVLCAYLTGKWVEKGLDRRVSTAFPGFLLGMALIYACGLLWLGVQTSWQNVLMMGLWPFLPGAAIKIIFASALMPSVWRLVNRA